MRRTKTTAAIALAAMLGASAATAQAPFGAMSQTRLTQQAAAGETPAAGAGSRLAELKRRTAAAGTDSATAAPARRASARSLRAGQAAGLPDWLPIGSRRLDGSPAPGGNGSVPRPGLPPEEAGPSTWDWLHLGLRLDPMAGCFLEYGDRMRADAERVARPERRGRYGGYDQYGDHRTAQRMRYEARWAWEYCRQPYRRNSGYWR